MAFVFKEVPTGAINGTNKVFTLLNAPSQIDDIFLDGVVYTDFTFSGNVITLNDAPALSIFVDYLYGYTAVPVTSDITFGDIKAEVWFLLGQTANSTIFSDTRVGDAVNSMLKQVITGRVTSRLDPNRIYRASNLWFMDGSFPIRNLAGSILVSPFEVGDTVINCDTSFLLTAGYVEIGGEIFQYTNKSPTQLLGVTGGTIEHLATEAVVQLYETPIAMDRPSSVNLVLKGRNIRTTPLPLDNSNTDGRYYQILRSGSKQLIKLVGLQSMALVDVQYRKRVDNMTANTDLCILPEDYGITVLAKLVAGTMGYDKGIPVATNLLYAAYSNLQNMYQDFTNETVVIKQKILPKSYSAIRR